jgi:Carboxypeptidase regulatory-like domain
MRSLRVALVALLIAALTPIFARAQGAATTGTITGTISDQTGAVIVGAEVRITDTATKIYTTVPTNQVGTFIFTNVKPGTYDVRVTKTGFQNVVVPAQELVVGQQLTLNLSMTVGAATQTVEVTSSAGAELQTMNATVGSTLAGSVLLSLPNQNRDATSLLMFQPMTAPTFHGAEGNTTGGQVAGSMSDQNTFTLDGGNATDDLAGDNNYVAGNRGYVGPQAAIPTPVESIEEFKVATNNQTADFSASAGGDVMLVTKRGGNSFHGSLYDYFQADWLNAAGWSLNVVNGTKVKEHQNRFGGSIGGPITNKEVAGGKTYFYFNYEGKRFPYANGRYERQVPSALLRQGIVQVKDNNGTENQYNLATSSQCGAALDASGNVTGPANLPCDPRGLGINPLISDMWNNYMPLPNDCANFGDHYNNCGYFAALKLNQSDNFMVVRLDHDFASRWRFMTSYRYYKLTYPSTNQVDIGGLLKGDTKGVPTAVSSNPMQPRYIVAGLTGTLTPTLTNDFHVSYLRNDWNWIRYGVPTGPLLPGTPFANIPGGLEVGGETNDPMAPLAMDTQDARFRTWNGHDWNYADSLSWLKGKHFFQFGGNVMHWWDNHVRPDNVTGSLTRLVYQINSGSGINMTPSTPTASQLYQPLHCSSDSSGPFQTNCVAGNQLGTWNSYYGEALGLVAQAQQLFVRGGSDFSLTGAPYLEDHSITNGYSLYLTDSFKVKPNLTINYGLEWGVTLPPYEENGVQDYLVDSSGAPVSYNQYVDNVQKFANNGQIYNPALGFEPIRGVGGSPKYPIDPWYGGFSPRVSLAWNPSFSSGFLHKIFGEKKTVFRGGYSRTYDRTNAVNMVLTPLLGYGFGQPAKCIGGLMDGTCTNTAKGSDPTNAYRVGTDGNTAPFPAITQTLPLPAQPGVNTPGASVLFALDSKWRPGSDDAIDFSIQRELPSQLILEVGYSGKWMKHLYLGMDNDGTPYMLKLGGQTLAQAYYALYQQDKAGVKPNAVSPQPFFETGLGGANSAYCKGYTSCTAAVEANEGSSGTTNITYNYVYQIAQDLDTANGGSPAWNFAGCTGCPLLASDRQQYSGIDMSTTNGYANYQAFFMTLQKRAGRGLTLSANFTYSKSLDTDGINQEFVEDSPNNIYNLRYDYAPAPWDRTLVTNVLGRYELPFGKGKHYSTSNGLLDRVIGGWSVSPIWTWGTGIPIESYTGSCYEFGTGQFPWCAGAVPLTNTGTFSKSPHLATKTDCTVGVNNDPSCSNGGGSGANLFPNPTAVFNSYRPAILGLDTRAYDLGPFHGQHRWNVDLTIEKDTKITERVNVQFFAYMLNAFNNMEYSDPGMNLLDPYDFGTLTGQYNPPRVIELGLRFSF